MHRIISNNHLAIIPNFFIGDFECDLFVINKSLRTTEYEIKTSLADYNNDFKKESAHFNLHERRSSPKNKHKQIQEGKRTNRFSFVLKKGIDVDVPDYAGLIVYEMHKHGIHFDIIKQAPLLSKDKVSLRLIKKCLCRLTWKYYACSRTIARGGQLDFFL